MPDGEIYLSDLRDRVTSQANGWGPLEWDLSNGEDGAGDGGPISVDGVTYAKGLGMHANGHVAFDLGGECTAFKSIVGIDDIQGAKGSVTFIVQGDGVELARSPELTGSSQAFAFDVNITGVKNLKLIADQGPATATTTPTGQAPACWRG
nr:NPCBM/NEW2 domain-containing protein [Tessaracoccus coleopterorum]